MTPRIPRFQKRDLLLTERRRYARLRGRQQGRGLLFGMGAVGRSVCCGGRTVVAREAGYVNNSLPSTRWNRQRSGFRRPLMPDGRRAGISPSGRLGYLRSQGAILQRAVPATKPTQQPLASRRRGRGHLDSHLEVLSVLPRRTWRHPCCLTMEDDRHFR